MNYDVVIIIRISETIFRAMLREIWATDSENGKNDFLIRTIGAENMVQNSLLLPLLLCGAEQQTESRTAELQEYTQLCR